MTSSLLHQVKARYKAFPVAPNIIDIIECVSNGMSLKDERKAGSSKFFIDRYSILLTFGSRVSLVVKNKNQKSIFWEFFFPVNSSRKNSIVLTLNVVALSRGCKKKLKNKII